MLNRALGRELLLLTGILLAGLFLGLAWGRAGQTVLAASAIYGIWQLRSLYLFNSWLAGRRKEPPGLTGPLWRLVVHHEKRLEAARAKQKKKYTRLRKGFQNSMSTLPDAVIVLTRELMMVWCNDTAEEWFGLQLGRDRGRKLSELVPKKNLQAFLESQDHGRPLDIYAPSSPRMQLRVRLVKYRRGRFLLQARDISQLKQLELVRQDFVANASHELRTPLTTLHGYLEMMQEPGFKQGSDWDAVAAQMYEQTSRIKRIVEDMLVLSRLENTDNRENWKSIDVVPILESLCQDAKALGSGKKHAIVLDAERGYRLQCAPADLHSLFSNLLSNAVRYTPANGKIIIHWWVDRRGAFYSVADTGIGIESEHISRLTERFYRVDAGRSQESGGTGLGLAIVHHVLRQHDGDLEVVSTPGKGSTFTCHFPTRLVEKQAA